MRPSLCPLLFSIFGLFSLPALGQMSGKEIMEEVKKFREETHADFIDIETSPLPIFRADEFEGLPYFEIDTAYYVAAKFVRSSEGKPFRMKTTTDRIAEYNVFGTAHFSINGVALNLTLYESIAKEGEDKHLFLPFTDKTNVDETYGGGRYVEVDYPVGDTLFIDFNRAYNPYCAYSDRYSCPLVPSSNRLSVPIKAGVKYEKHPESWSKVDEQPTYPGGAEKLFNTLYGNLELPEVKEKLDGIVYLGLLIDKEGKVSERKVLQGFHEACDEAALKASESLDAFIPAKKDGKPVRFQVVIPVRIKV